MHRWSHIAMQSSGPVFEARTEVRGLDAPVRRHPPRRLEPHSSAFENSISSYPRVASPTDLPMRPDRPIPGGRGNSIRKGVAEIVYEKVKGPGCQLFVGSIFGPLMADFVLFLAEFRIILFNLNSF